MVVILEIVLAIQLQLVMLELAVNKIILTVGNIIVKIPMTSGLTGNTMFLVV